MKFVFYQSQESSVVKVSADTLYGKSGAGGMTDSKFGFVTERNRNSSSYLKIPELTSGFVPASCFGTSEVTEICQDSCGCFIKSKYDGLYPLSFRLDVHDEGIYSVTVKVYGGDEADDVLIFTNNRQLVFRGTIKNNDSIVKTFPVTVYPIIPSTHKEAADTTGITVTVIGRGVRIQSVETVKSNRPVLWIAGDDTAAAQSCEYPYVSGTSPAGWGQMLPAFIGNEYAVTNHAHSGLSLESFRSEGHYDIMRNCLRRNNVVLFQFKNYRKNNDGKKSTNLDAEKGFRKQYTKYIDEIRSAGGIPVIVTPLAGNEWNDDGKNFNDLLSACNDECLSLGKELDVPVVKLHDIAVDFIMRNGRDAVKKYFCPSDDTQPNDYGAFFFAGIVYSELVRLGILDEGIKSAAINTESPLWTAPEKITLPEIPLA